MVGCLMGARLGFENIPEVWRDGVLNARALHDIASHLADQSLNRKVSSSCCNVHTLDYLVKLESLFTDDKNK